MLAETHNEHQAGLELMEDLPGSASWHFKNHFNLNISSVLFSFFVLKFIDNMIENFQMIPHGVLKFIHTVG